MINALFASLLSCFSLFTSPAFAEEPSKARVEATNTQVDLKFVEPNTVGFTNHLDQRHYLVRVYELSDPKPGCIDNHAQILTLKPMFEATFFAATDPENYLVLNPGSHYLVETYHQIGIENGTAKWVYDNDSCKLFHPVLPGPDLSFQMNINWEAPTTSYSADLTLNVPPVKEDYYLIPQQSKKPEDPVDCAKEFVAKGMAASVTGELKLHARRTDLTRTLTGGEWAVGIYERKKTTVKEGGAETEAFKYTLVGGTCSYFAVYGFGTALSYAPEKPLSRRVLLPEAPTVLASAPPTPTPEPADPPPPKPTVDDELIVGLRPMVALDSGQPGIGMLGLVHYQRDHLVVFAAAGVHSVNIPGEMISGRTHLETGVGAGFSAGIIGTELFALGGLGSFQAQCGPETFDLDATSFQVTCGRDGDFPLQVVAPFFGVGGSGRLMFPVHSEKPGRPNSVGIGLHGELNTYMVGSSHTWDANVHSDEGDRAITFGFDRTYAFVYPVFGLELLAAW